jgi:hypothetical protein
VAPPVLDCQSYGLTWVMREPMARACHALASERREALDRSRRDIPRLALKLPALIRSTR